MTPKPLEGITVVSIEQALAAPLCSCRLADAGARVIKVERPEGDFARGYDDAVHGVASYFVWTNRGKESVVLDLKAASDVALLHRILAGADVFIQNLAPGATDRLGLGSAALRGRYPRLITCDITGYGEGPYRDMKAYDFLVQCESGLVSISGAPGAPGRFGVSICDIGAGMNAAQGVMQALFHRERTGEATGFSVSLFDTAADWMSVPLVHEEYGRGAPQPMGMQHPSMAPYGAYRAGDGNELVIAIQNDREWAKLCEIVLERPELTRDPRFATNNDRAANRAAVSAVIDERFARLGLGALKVVLDLAGIAYGSVNSVAQLAEHPQLRRWPMTVAGQPVEYVAPPLQTPFDDGRFRDVPALGQHTAAIRAEFSS
jgi:crotonobetainyl-CoA:carnitine CoA-transferase CaiB-like acyl-CoA transferase